MSSAVASSPSRAADASDSSPMIPVVLFLAAAVSVSLRMQSARFGSGFETIAVARSLAEHGRFADPYSTYPTGTTAHVAPLYPAFLSVLLRIFGYSAKFGVVTSACSMAVHGLHAAILPYLSKLFFRDRRPGIWAAVLTIVLPIYFFFPQFEVIYFATAVMLFCLVSYRLAAPGGGVQAFGTGVALSLIALLNPASICMTLPWLAYLLWRYVEKHRQFVLFAGLGIVAALAPWTWRNYRQFHALFFVRDNLGLELYVSNSNLAQGSLQQNMASGLYQQRHPDKSLQEAQECARLGEIEYNRERMHSTLTWIRNHPERFLTLAASHARLFWFPDVEGFAFYAYSIAGVTILSALGFLLLVRRREPVMLYLATVQLLYPMLYYLVQIDPRFRAPILWVSLMGAGYLLADGWSRLRPA
jgi:hypothetical protein